MSLNGGTRAGHLTVPLEEAFIKVACRIGVWTSCPQIAHFAGGVLILDIMMQSSLRIRWSSIPPRFPHRYYAVAVWDKDHRELPRSSFEFSSATFSVRVPCLAHKTEKKMICG